MKNIGFAIPSWNRADQLQRCVNSIATQSPAKIIICDNASTDHTPQVCDALVAQYPGIVEVHRFEDHVGGSASFRRAVNAAADLEYLWTFGDDDWLCPGALEFVQSLVNTTKCAFYHVAETRRASRQNGASGDFQAIVNAIGLTEFTGFISCNITRTELLKAGVNSKHWDVYMQGSFPQSLATYEMCHDKPSMMVQVGCVMAADETDDTRARWKEEKVCWKYLYLGEGLMRLHEDGVMPDKVPEVFYRYLDGALFARFMNDFYYKSTADVESPTDRDWDIFEWMVGRVEGERGRGLREWVIGARKIAQENADLLKRAAVIHTALSDATVGFMLPGYPRDYLPE